MCRQAVGSKYVILQKIDASIPVRVDCKTLTEGAYGPILYEGLESLADEAGGRGSFSEVLKAIAGFDTSRHHTLQKRPLKAGLRSAYSTSRC